VGVVRVGVRRAHRNSSAMGRETAGSGTTVRPGTFLHRTGDMPIHLSV